MWIDFTTNWRLWWSVDHEIIGDIRFIQIGPVSIEMWR